MTILDTDQQDAVMPEVVAEISANHNGSLDRALAIVSAVAEAGASAVKLQTYTADTITLDHNGPEFQIPETQGLWGGRRLYDLYTEAHTPWEWHGAIFEHARQLGLDVFSTPFDETAVDFLEELEVSRYKIASLEIVDIPLIEKVASTGKPIILSTGASTCDDVSQAVNAIRAVGDNPITLLVCSSSYPSDAGDSNLLSMATIRERFKTEVGFSDHTPGIGPAIAAAVLGANLIEKHVTLDSDSGGPDDAFSVGPEVLKALVRGITDALASLGSRELFVADSEVISLNLRPSLWITRDVDAGELVSESNVSTLRPSGGLPPSKFREVLGKKFSESFPRGTPLTLEKLRK